MERSGTLSEPSDNSTTPYIKKRPTLLGQPLNFIYLYLLYKPRYVVKRAEYQQNIHHLK